VELLISVVNGKTRYRKKMRAKIMNYKNKSVRYFHSFNSTISFVLLHLCSSGKQPHLRFRLSVCIIPQ
jgi:hypothetical protein